jgi:hypothetical protein
MRNLLIRNVEKRTYPSQNPMLIPPPPKTKIDIINCEKYGKSKKYKIQAHKRGPQNIDSGSSVQGKRKKS